MVRSKSGDSGPGRTELYAGATGPPQDLRRGEYPGASSLLWLHLVLSEGADRAIQAIKAMQKHRDDELLLGLGALCVTRNGGEKKKEPVKVVSA